ncbi:MAG: GntR family transcriptional regulator [Amaricoccus sp.]
MLPGYGSRVISDGVAGSANSGVGTPVRAGGLAKALLADVAYERLVAKLRHGEVRAGEFVSIPTLVRMLAMPLAPVREAVKRAEARSLVSVLPKRGVSIMTATAAEIRDCLDLRSILEEEAARRLIASPLPPPLGGMWNERLRIVEGSLEGADSVLTKRVVDVELSLHDFLATGIENPLATEVYLVNRDRISVIQHSRPLPPARIASVMEEQLAILDALERRDAEGAVHAIHAHNRATMRWWGALLQTA